jgi:hypothetical protein
MSEQDASFSKENVGIKDAFAAVAEDEKTKNSVD